MHSASHRTGNGEIFACVCVVFPPPVCVCAPQFDILSNQAYDSDLAGPASRSLRAVVSCVARRHSIRFFPPSIPFPSEERREGKRSHERWGVGWGGGDGERDRERLMSL